MSNHPNTQDAAANGTKVLIVDRNGTNLQRVQESTILTGAPQRYVFEGPCAEFNNGLNDNNRYYDRDEYLSHFTYLQPEIEANSLMGELDHHEEYMPSMKRLSHIVRKLWYRPELDQVWIRIELLDTQDGKDAKAVADAGAPIFVSSRASGYIADDGKTTLEHIYTFDIVYRPGFRIAKLKRLNESLSNSRHDFLQIYEWNDSFGTPHSVINTHQQPSRNPSIPGQMTYLTEAQFQEFTNQQNKRIDEKFESLRQMLKTNTSESSTGAPLEAVVNELANIKKFLNVVVEQVNGQGSYATLQSNFTNELADYSDRISARVNELAQYAELVASTANGQVAFSNVIAARSNEQAEFMNLIGNRVNEQAEFMNLIGNRVNEQGEYAGIVANRVNEQGEYLGLVANRTNEQSEYMGLVANRTNEHTEFMNLVSGRVNQVSEYSTTIAQAVNTLGGVSPVTENTRTKRPTNEASTLPTALGKGSVTEAVDNVLSSVRQNKTGRAAIVLETHYPFVLRMDDPTRSLFENLSDIKQKRIAGLVNESANWKGGTASGVEIAGVIAKVSQDTPGDLLMETMPKRYVKAWESFGAHGQEQLFSLFQRRDIHDRINAELFWETLDFDRMAGVQSANENLTQGEMVGLVPTLAPGVSGLGYSMDDVDQSLGYR